MRYLVILSLLAYLLGFAAAEYFPYSETWPAPRQGGWDRKCTEWIKAQAGDTCWQIASKLNIDIGSFTHMNPQLQGDCVHNLWAGYWYCIGYYTPPPEPSTLPRPDNTETDFTTKSTDRVSFSAITDDTPITFTTKSTNGVSFSAITDDPPITKSEVTKTITQFVRESKPPVHVY